MKNGFPSDKLGYPRPRIRVCQFFSWSLLVASKGTTISILGKTGLKNQFKPGLNITKIVPRKYEKVCPKMRKYMKVWKKWGKCAKSIGDVKV